MRTAITAAVCLAGTLACFATRADDSSKPGTTQQAFREVYQQLVEINTTHSAGDTTVAARAMAKRLTDAGFAESDIQIIEPFPRKGNLVLRWHGSGAKQPILLVAHLDVVEAKRSDWKTDPFKLQDGDGYFTARGSIDDKAMASSFVSILAQLKQEGYTPSRDIILALTADEERGGVPSNGASWLVANKPDLLRAEFGINEGGGGELRGGKPALHRVQVAEKIFITYELEVHDVGGHSSVPHPFNPIYELSAGLQRLAAYSFPVSSSEVTRVYFERSARFATGQQAADMKAIGAGRTDAAVVARLAKSPLYNAQLRTTCIATMVEAGHAENALPQSAKATVNCRILPQDDPAVVDRQLRKVLGSDKIEVKAVGEALRSPPSPLRPDVLGTIERLTGEMWPGTPVIPFMSTGATDSRFLRNVGTPMYGVSGLFTDPADLRTHGLDERIEIQRLYDGREFMYRMVKALAS